LNEAIQLSIQAAEQTNLAAFHANQIAASPPMSPRTQRYQEDRALREEQDRAYEEALRVEREKAENARKMVEAANRAQELAEEATRKLQEVKQLENAKRENLRSPILRFPIEDANTGDLLMLRFKLPDGSTINHTFHRNEPLESLIQQLRFDLKHLGDFILVIQPNTIINCSRDTAIGDCGVQNRVLVHVRYV
jgi:ATPase subunit of ABC transporter with duplicated ATPase domains